MKDALVLFTLLALHATGLVSVAEKRDQKPRPPVSVRGEKEFNCDNRQ